MIFHLKEKHNNLVFNIGNNVKKQCLFFHFLHYILLYLNR